MPNWRANDLALFGSSFKAALKRTDSHEERVSLGLAACGQFCGLDDVVMMISCVNTC
jgi:hypothetical protein